MTQAEGRPEPGAHYIARAGKLPGDEVQWVQIPLPAAMRETAWHYTDTGGLLGIVNNHELWASAPSSLNDTSELDYGADLVRGVWAELREDSSLRQGHREFLDEIVTESMTNAMHQRVFLLSASRDGDLLNQWQHYAHRGGVAVALDGNARLEPRPVPGDVPLRPPPDGPMTTSGILPGWCRVAYDQAEQRDWATQLLLFLSPPETASARLDKPLEWQKALEVSSLILGTLLCHFKHPSFAAEQEVRYLAAPAGPSSYERFRAAGPRIVPYVGLASDLPAATDGPLRLPIRAVVCGPTSGLKSEVDVQRLLRARGYTDVPVTSSRIPFR